MPGHIGLMSSMLVLILLEFDVDELF